MFDVIIVGGGLAGLINSIVLKKYGYAVLLIERRKYPFHRVCGEYISNEVIHYLKSIDCYPEELNPVDITNFQLTSPNGDSATMPLDLGGFGISRYVYDAWLAKKAENAGVLLMENTIVTKIQFNDDVFTVLTDKEDTHTARVVIGAFGKRSSLDRILQRKYFRRRSPYVGVKYHIAGNFNPSQVALHNFEGGYCGISDLGDGIFNLCYLSSVKPLKRLGSIQRLEDEILFQNPYLKSIFNEAEILFDKPITVNDISFSAKEPVYQHILMSGDAAGVITPLCGNGMAMAIHSAKILSEKTHHFLEGQTTRAELEGTYAKEWKEIFGFRVWYGRQVQQVFGNKSLSNVAVALVNNSKLISKLVMRQTHGRVF